MSRYTTNAGTALRCRRCDEDGRFASEALMSTVEACEVCATCLEQEISECLSMAKADIADAERMAHSGRLVLSDAVLAEVDALATASKAVAS